MMYTDGATGLPTDDPMANVNPQPAQVAQAAAVQPTTPPIVVSSPPSVAAKTKEPEPVVVDSAPFMPPPQIPSIDYANLPNFNQINPAATESYVMGDDVYNSINNSEIMDPNITISQDKFKALSSSMLYPSFFIQDKLGIEAMKYEPSRVMAAANKWLSTSKTKEQYASEFNSAVDAATSNKTTQNGFIDFTNIPAGDHGKGASTIRTGSGDYKSNFIGAIAAQESGNDYTKTNEQSGALGKYQVMPVNLLNPVKENWGLQALGRMIKPEEFLKSPELQEKVANFKLSQYYETAKSSGLSDEDSAKYASTSWYSGENQKRISNGKLVFLASDKVKQAGGNPSIEEYASQVASKIPKAQVQQFKDTPTFDSKDYRPASAIADLTAASKFYNQYKGTSIPNPDGTFYGQCVSLVRSYYKEVLGVDVPRFGNAWAGLTAPELDNNFKTLNKDYRPQINDIFFQPIIDKVRPYGHTGIIMSSPDKNDNVLVLEQNVNGPTPSIREVPISSFSGVRRFKT